MLTLFAVISAWLPTVTVALLLTVLTTTEPLAFGAVSAIKVPNKPLILLWICLTASWAFPRRVPFNPELIALSNAPLLGSETEAVELIDATWRFCALTFTSPFAFISLFIFASVLISAFLIAAAIENEGRESSGNMVVFAAILIKSFVTFTALTLMLFAVIFAPFSTTALVSASVVVFTIITCQLGIIAWSSIVVTFFIFAQSVFFEVAFATKSLLASTMAPFWTTTSAWVFVPNA